MKVYFKNEKKPICTEIFIHILKYINIFLILYTKCVRIFWYILQSAANQKRLVTTGLVSYPYASLPGFIPSFPSPFSQNPGSLLESITLSLLLLITNSFAQIGELI
jgi:hypothetical protein